MTTANYPNSVFRLRAAWKLIWNGVVPATCWQDRSGAEAQLDLLRTGYTVLCEDSTLRHVGAMKLVKTVVR